MPPCILLITILFFVFFNSVSTHCDDAKARLAAANMGLSGRYLYRHFAKYPNQSYTVVTLPAFCILGQLALHAEGEDYERIMDFLDLESKEEIKEVLPETIWYLQRYSQTLFKLTFGVFGDDKQRFTNKFKQNLADICGGDLQLIDYDNPVGAFNVVRDWFANQSSHSPRTLTRPDMFSNDKGLLLTTSMDFISNFDHEYNPNGLIDIDYHVTQNEILTFPSLYGIGLIRYGEIIELDIKVLEFLLKGGELSAVFFYPNNPDNLLSMLELIQDPYVYFDILNRAEWMCVKMHVTVGHCHVANDLTEFLPELNLNTTDFHGVFKSGEPAKVNYIFQQLHLIADTTVRQGQLNSKWCPDHNVPFVKMNHPCSYYVITPEGLPVYAGILYGPQDYSN